MPEFLRFEGDEAIIAFNNARKFVVDENNKAQPVGAPREAHMKSSDLQQYIGLAERNGKDPSFFVETLAKLEAHMAEHSLKKTEEKPAPQQSWPIKPTSF